jgi:hypothetical protein
MDSRRGRHAGYQPPSHPAGYQQQGFQTPGIADVVSYGFKPAQSAAGHQAPQPGGPASSLDDAPGQPGWVGQPATGHPEFAPDGPSEAEPKAVGARRARRDASRRGRRRGIWLWAGAVLAVVVAAVAMLSGRFGQSGHSAHPAKSVAVPAHVLAVPQRIGSYTRDEQAEQQVGLSHSEQYLTQINPGHVSGIVAAIYDTAGSASSPDRVAVIAGRLVRSPLAGVIKSFDQQESAEGNLPLATPAGPLGGQAACAGKGSSGICVWADRDTVGVLVSATVNSSSLARLMLTIRSGIEVPPP